MRNQMAAFLPEVLGPADAPEIVDVFCDAFDGYPVMMYVLGPAGDTRDRLQQLIGYFVGRRVRLGGPLFGVREAGALVGAATVTAPAETEPPADLLRARSALFDSIGADCRGRHEKYGAAAALFGDLGPHHHLNMLGVRRAHQGRGLARPLLEAVCDLARSHHTSTGVSLTTETPENLRLYQHFGFQIVGEARVDESFQTWGLFWNKAASSLDADAKVL